MAAAVISVQILGGDLQTMEHFDGMTIGDVKEELGLPTHVATLNGEPVSDEDEVPEFGFVSLSTPVKGGLA